jgi:KipI family sensor histidine kinase inhibitor
MSGQDTAGDPGQALIAPLGDSAWTVTWPGAPSPAHRAAVWGLNQSLQAAQQQGRLPALREWSPALSSLTVIVDAAQAAQDDWPKPLQALLQQATTQAPEARRWRLPVCFDADLAPDLAELAEQAQCAVGDYVAHLCAQRLSVYMLGFMPGFPYMGDLSGAWAPPRLAAPRTRVPARSLALAAGMAAVYPWDSPGGWRLVGQTPLQLFSLRAEPPALFAAGDVVCIQAIARAEFEALAADAAWDWAPWCETP